MATSDRERMLMNWPERAFIYSPVRVLIQLRHVARWIRIAGRQTHSRGLEIGCGLGRGARIATTRLGVRKIFAFDLEHALVQKGASAASKASDNRIAFLTADGQDIPFAGACFDAVIDFGIIHHVLDWRRCLSEIERVLKPGGYFYFEEIFPPLYANFLMKRLVRHPEEGRFGREEFLAALAERGLRTLSGDKRSSRFGIVDVARKDPEPNDLFSRP